MEKGTNALRRILLSFLSVTLLFSAFAQTNTAKTVSITANCGGYYEYLPASYNSTTQKYPVVFYLHSAAVYGKGTSTDLQKLLTEGIPYYINNKTFPASFTVNGQTSSFIVISPQFIAKPSMADVKAVIDYVSANYRIDKARIYLTGHSVGGDATIKYPNTGLTPSKQLAGIAASSAFNNPYVDSGAKYIAAANLPVRMYHSTDDTQAPYTWSQNFVNKINSYNPAVKAQLYLFSGYTHSVAWQRMFDPTFRDGGYNVYEWLLTGRRDQPPVALAGNDTTITWPANTVNLNGSNSYDPDKDPITYSWKKISGPAQYNFSNATVANPTVTGLIPGNYTFQLTVTDTFSYNSVSSVNVTVFNPNPNVPPVANAGPDQNLLWPANTVTVNGSASTDPDGAIQTYRWNMIAGNGGTISDTTAISPKVSNLKPGQSVFVLTVTDNQGASNSDTTVVTIVNNNLNVAPTVTAGIDTTIYLPVSSIALNKASANDPDGQIVSYRWTKLSGPTSYLFSDSTILNPTVSNLTEGTYQFSLSVKDDSSAISTATIKVTVSAIQRVLIDVGPNLTTSPDQWGKYWNNMTDGRAGVRISNAVTALNQSTTVSLEVVNRIDGTYNTAGTGLNSGNGTGIVGDYTANATDDYAFSYEGTTNGRWRIFGLNPQSTYTIKFWGTRATTSDRIIQIKKTTDTVWQTYNAANNKNINTAASFTVTGLTEVSFDILTKTGSTFGYINVIDINIYNTPSSGNQSPVVYAGADQSVALPNNTGITLTGTASDPDGTIASTLWSQISGPSSTTIATPTSLSTTINGFVTGIYQYELKATDNLGAVSKDTIQVTALAPAVPKAVDTINCGRTLKIVVLGSSTAYGKGATPVDSSWVNKYLLYIKSKNSANTIVNLAEPGYTTYDVLRPTGYIPPTNRPAPDSLHNITKALSLNPDLIIVNLPSNDVAYDYTLTEQKANYAVAQSLADSAHVPVWITTPQPRSNLNAGELDSLKAMVTWTNSYYGSHAIDFWTTIANPDGTINPLYAYGDNVHVNNAGHHVLYTRVVENRLLDSMCLRLKPNIPPVVTVSGDQTITLPVNSVTVSGSATDSDGTIASTNWSQVSGPSTATISSPSSLQTSITSLIQGTYQFALKATDNQGAATSASLKVIVNAPPPLPSKPVANAGSDQIITLPVNSVILSGSATDSGSTIASTLWTQISGPASANIATPSSLQTNVSSLQAGIYKFQLKVIDSLNDADSGMVSVTVNPAPNKLPVVSAGADQTITLPTNSVNLTGSANDSDGTIVSTVWTQISGPSTATITNGNTLSATVSGLVQGVYKFQLKATDNAGGSSVSTVQVTVNAAPVTGTTKYIKVQVYGGTGAYIDTQWNNWNVGTASVSNVSSTTFNYSDGTKSAISTNLSYTQAIGDNNAGYASTISNTMCPAAVLRYTSYSNSLRTLTINGLNTSVKYNLELYASRYSSGNTTIFTVNGTSVTITTYDNYTNKAAFSNIVPNAQGQIIVTIDKGSTYNYLNGFMITEQGATASLIVNNQRLNEQTELKLQGFNVYPNPAHNNIKLTLNDPYSGMIHARIIDMNGRVLKQEQLIKNEVQKNWTIPLTELNKGVYLIQLQIGNKTVSKEIIIQ